MPHRVLLFSLLSCASLLLVGCDPAAEPASVEGNRDQPRLSGQAAIQPGPRFRVADPSSGFAFQHHNGMQGELWMIELLGSGAAMVDYDRDGDLDIYMVQGGPLVDRESATLPGDRLYQNRWVETGRVSFVDVTKTSGIRATGYGMGVAVADVNGDGLPDIYVTNYGPNQLWINRGDGTFEDRTREAGVESSGFSTGATFLDYDRDGRLDLLVTDYLIYATASEPNCFDISDQPDYCSPKSHPYAPNTLFRNLGAGHFEDTSATTGIAAVAMPSFQAVTSDFDGDGWPDLLVANDGEENTLWHNENGSHFVNMAPLAGVAVNMVGASEASMGVSVTDFDNDGNSDLLLTHLSGETNTLYLNDGSGFFSDISSTTGQGASSRSSTGWGVNWLDWDHDGDSDLFIANGGVRFGMLQTESRSFSTLAQSNHFYRHDIDDRLKMIKPRYTGNPTDNALSRGSAAGDIDNDGDIDLLVSNNNGPAQLLINETSHRNHWIGLDIVNSSGSRYLPGMKVRLTLTGGEHIYLFSHFNESYLSSNDPRFVTGIGSSNAPVNATITWPDGTNQSVEALLPDRYHRVEYPGQPLEVVEE